MQPTITVLIAEDHIDHRDMVTEYVADVFGEVAHAIVYATGENEIEAVVARSENGAPLFIVFDLQIQDEHGTNSLDEYVKRLWSEPAQSPRGKIPLVVFSAHATTGRFNKLPKRANRRSVSKIQQGDQDIYEELTKSLRECLQRLLAERSAPSDRYRGDI